MKKIIIFSVITATILLISGSAKFLNKKTDISQIGKEKNVNMTINDGEKNILNISAESEEEKTVLDLLGKKTAELGLSLKTKNYDIGVFVEAIGNNENGQNGKYWLYYVNGEMPQISVDKKEIKPGDKIEFKFEKSPF
jgi:hypothetical protein